MSDLGIPTLAELRDQFNLASLWGRIAEADRLVRVIAWRKKYGGTHRTPTGKEISE